MTLTVWPRVDPWWAFASGPESSGEIRPEKRPFHPPVAVVACPNAIPVVSSNTTLRRLPQPALCRSPRTAGFGDFFLCSIKSHPFLLVGGKDRASYPWPLLHGRNQSKPRK